MWIFCIPRSARRLKACGLAQALLVVDALDMFRAAACFARQGIEVIPAASHYRARPFEFTSLTLVRGLGGGTWLRAGPA
jgi:uncharacterized SAM-binding protein YcdF (DUF218 family)